MAEAHSRQAGPGIYISFEGPAEKSIAVVFIGLIPFFSSSPFSALPLFQLFPFFSSSPFSARNQSRTGQEVTWRSVISQFTATPGPVLITTTAGGGGECLLPPRLQKQPAYAIRRAVLFFDDGLPQAAGIPGVQRLLLPSRVVFNIFHPRATKFVDQVRGGQVR